MIKISQQYTVNRPVEEVFRFLTDAGNIFKYSRSILEVRQLTKGPIGIGSKYALVSRFLGQRVPMELEVVEFEVNKGLASKSNSGPFKLFGRTTFESVGENTVVTQTSEIQPTGFWRAIQGILPAIIRRQSDAETVTLRRVLETHMHQVDEHMEVLNISKTVVSLAN